jgi:phage/plasmid-associated DNA primase
LILQKSVILLNYRIYLEITSFDIERMDKILELVDYDYTIMSVGGKTTKQPLNRDGLGLDAWQRLPHSEIMKHFNDRSKRFGLRTGKQGNDRYIASLDWDCCGKKGKDGRMGCDYTKEKLQKYNDIKTCDDGMFKGGTTGNFNLLFDFTDIPELVERFQQLIDEGKKKIELQSLEILYSNGSHQVIPPSATLSKITNEIGESREFLNERPFIVLTTDMPETSYILEILNEYDTMKKKPVVKKPVVRSITPLSSEDEKEVYMTDYDDMIINGLGKKRLEYNEYLRLASVLKTNNVSVDIWNKWNTECCNVDDDDHVKRWRDCVIDTDLKMSFVEGMCKKYDPTYYKKWKGTQIRKMTSQTLKLGHRDVAEVCSKKMNRLKYCNDCWYLCRENTNLWAVVKKPHSYIVKIIQDEINDLITDTTEAIKNASDNRRKELEEERKELFKCYSVVAGTGYAPCVMNYLAEYLYEDKFNEKIDYNIGFLAFKNGILNLKTGVFRKGLLPEDYISFTLDFDYKQNSVDENSFVWRQFKKVLNNNDTHLDYFMSLVGHSFTGESSLVKAMYFMIDGSGDSKGDNGKSFLFSIFKNIMGDYVGKPTSSLLEKNNSKVHKQITGLKGKRFIYMEEFPQKAINCDLMKELGDGGEMNNEVMFGTMEKINIIGMFFALSNHTPKLDADESAGYNRYKEVSFKSHFDRTGDREEENEDELEYIADTGIGAKIVNEYRDEVIGLILKYAMRFYKSGIPPTPIEFLKAEQQTKASNDEFLDWFQDYIEGCEDDRVAEKRLSVLSTFDVKKVRKGMMRLGYKYDRNLRGLGTDGVGKHYKGGYELMK